MASLLTRIAGAAVAGAALATGLFAPAAYAQVGPSKEVFTSAGAIDAKIATLNNGSITYDAPSSAGIRFLVVRRDRPGEVEVHGLANDQIYVVQGKATIVVGGIVTGNRVTAPNEWRGGTLTGGVSYPVAPGDTIHIPAGVPHQVLAPAGSDFRYLAVKDDKAH